MLQLQVLTANMIKTAGILLFLLFNVYSYFFNSLVYPISLYVNRHSDDRSIDVTDFNVTSGINHREKAIVSSTSPTLLSIECQSYWTSV